MRALTCAHAPVCVLCHACVRVRVVLIVLVARVCVLDMALVLLYCACVM